MSGTAASAGSAVEFHYTYTGEPGTLEISVIEPDGSVSIISPEEAEGLRRYAFVDDGPFPDYYKELVFRFRWIQLPPDHSVKLRNPIDFLLPMRYREGIEDRRVITFSVLRSFNYRVADELDGLTSVDLGTKFINAGLGAKYYAPKYSKVATNWARIWFDSALQLAKAHAGDTILVGEDARDNFTKRVSKEQRDAVWGRWFEIAARFFHLDGSRLNSLIAAAECSEARRLYDQLVEKHAQRPKLLKVARPNENAGYYLDQKLRELTACEQSHDHE